MRLNMLLLQFFISVEILENILPIYSKIPEPNFYIFLMVLYPVYIHSKNEFVPRGIYELLVSASQEILLVCYGMV